MPRDKIILACSDCKNRNYFTTKNKRLHPERVEWKKYCPRCNKHSPPQGNEVTWPPLLRHRKPNFFARLVTFYHEVVTR